MENEIVFQLAFSEMRDKYLHPGKIGYQIIFESDYQQTNESFA
jgi:hypothetical protein